VADATEKRAIFSEIVAMGEEFCQSACDLDDQIVLCDKLVHSTEWSGPSADSFKCAWGDNRHLLEGIKQACQELGTAIKTIGERYRIGEDGVMRRVKEPWRKTGSAASSQARRLARADRGTCQAYLAGRGAAADGATAPAATLNIGEQTGSIQVLRRERQKWLPGEGIGWLASADACWRVQPAQETGPLRLRLVPAASSELAAELTEMLGGITQAPGLAPQRSA
jgi:hypothetical protein